jgi:hypothetical protein
VGKIAAVESLCRASSRQSCFREDPKEARLRVHRKCFLQAHRLDASVLRLHGADTQTKHFNIDVDGSRPDGRDSGCAPISDLRALPRNRVRLKADKTPLTNPV